MMTSFILHEAASALRRGELVAFPTETVYGLGGNALLDIAMAEIFAVKGRPAFNPLIIHVPDAQAAAQYAQFNAQAQALAQAFWPGPLTLVLPRKKKCGISLLASAGLDTIAVRVPAHPLAQALLQEAGVPLAAPSANRSGRISPTTAAHVREELGDALHYILDGGACRVGIESTVLDVTGGTPALLRPGAITQEAVEAVLGVSVTLADATSAAQPASPGMLASHYAPDLPLRTHAQHVNQNEALLAFGSNPPAGAAHALNLSPAGEMKEAATNLFAYLRRLDRPEFSGIAVMPIPEEGLGIAINNRLRRAAFPRA